MSHEKAAKRSGGPGRPAIGTAPLKRRQFLARGAAAVGVGWASGLGIRRAGAAVEPATELIFQSATQMARMIREKKVSAVEVVTLHLKRISEVNPKIRAVVTLCEERALKEAKAADEAQAKGRMLGVLHGVPFTLKDSLETEGVRSTSGTLGRSFCVPSKDATVAARLRAAGAILLGKSNTPEFTMGGGSKGTNNLLFGQTYNPYDLARSPLGSSGGGGAIVAAGGSAFDVGSDLGGSVRLPAHASGVAGIKPTSGRTPRTGHVPGYGGLFDSWQQLGPLARRVEDIELLMSVLCGEDLEDAFCFDVPLGNPGTVLTKGLKVAFYVDNGVMSPTPETQAMVRTAAEWLREAGAEVREDIHPGYKADVELASRARDGEGGAWQRRLLKKHGTAVPDPGLLERMKGKPVPAPEFLEMMEDIDHARSRMLQWFKGYDAILCPTSAIPAPRLDTPAPRETNYTRIYNVTGWPAAVVRAGTSPEGMPLGLQIVAKPWNDHVALALARFVEERSGGWKRPNL
jgi:amidase